MDADVVGARFDPADRIEPQQEELVAGAHREVTQEPTGHSFLKRLHATDCCSGIAAIARCGDWAPLRWDGGGTRRDASCRESGKRKRAPGHPGARFRYGSATSRLSGS